MLRNKYVLLLIGRIQIQPLLSSLALLLVLLAFVKKSLTLVHEFQQLTTTKQPCFQSNQPIKMKSTFNQKLFFLGIATVSLPFIYILHFQIRKNINQVRPSFFFFCSNFCSQLFFKVDVVDNFPVIDLKLQFQMRKLHLEKQCRDKGYTQWIQPKPEHGEIPEFFIVPELGLSYCA